MSLRIVVLASVAMLAAGGAASAAWEMPAQVAASAAPAGCGEAGARAVAAYPVCEDQARLLADAVAAARAKGKLLVIEFGATWCPQCGSLAQTLPGTQVLGYKSEDFDFAAGFDLVKIGTSTLAKGNMVEVPQGEAILAAVLAKAPGAEWRGWPFLAVIDPANDRIAFTRNTGDLLGGDGLHDPARLRAALKNGYDFLRRGIAPPAEGRGGRLSRLYHWFFD